MHKVTFNYVALKIQNIMPPLGKKSKQNFPISTSLYALYFFPYRFLILSSVPFEQISMKEHNTTVCIMLYHGDPIKYIACVKATGSHIVLDHVKRGLQGKPRKFTYLYRRVKSGSKTPGVD